MKRRGIILIIAIVLIVIYIHVEKRFPFDKLLLNQGNTYIALSKNDVSGYNRWIPFYFTLSTYENLSEEEVNRFLQKNILQAKVYFKNVKEIYQTNELIWSACKIDEGVYNLTLVVIPEVEEINLKSIDKIETVELLSSINSYKYTFEEYWIEERETIPEADLYTSLSSVEAEVNEVFRSKIHYGVCQKRYDATNFEIDFSSDFSDVINYTIVDEIDTENNCKEYILEVCLDKDYSKTVFRPFLKIWYNNTEGWMIPCVPVYFK